MQLIQRSPCPDLLEQKQEQWTISWVAHYRWRCGVSIEPKKPQKPSDNHWLHDDIRLLLIQDFHNNCGYCGEVLPTPQGKVASKGDVDHFLPKAIYPEHVYQWENYIWSCKPCNQLKKEFYSTKFPLLHPCDGNDCSKLLFIENTGQYILDSLVSADSYWQKRLQHSEQKTMLNAVEICKKRRLKISTLRKNFESISNNIKNIASLQSVNPSVTDSLQKHINQDTSNILEIINSPEFYVLLKEHYQLLRREHPQVAKLLVE